MPSALEDYMMRMGYGSSATGSLGITPPPAPNLVVPRFTSLGDRMAAIGGFGDQPGELRTVEQLRRMSQQEIDEYERLRKSARNRGISQSLIAIGQAFEGKIPQPKAEQVAKQGSLWKDQDSGQTFRELIIGDELFFQSPNTGQSLSLEEMQSLYPNIRPTTAGEPARYFSSFDDFRKESSELLTTGQSIDRLNKYLDNLQRTPIGLQRLYEKFSTAIKTIAGDSDLTEQEVALKVASGNLQGLVGANRLEIAGPGVLTEQDWQRILDALGGDVTLLQNPTIVFPLINEILQDKVERYNDQASFYNAAVESGNYGTSFKAKDIKQFTPRSYLPEGAPAGSRLIGVEGNTLYYITPDGQAFKYEQD